MVLPTTVLNAPEAPQFLKKINKARLMTFLIKVNVASSRIQGAFKKSQKRKRFIEFLAALQNTSASAQNHELANALNQLGFKVNNMQNNNNSRK